MKLQSGEYWKGYTDAKKQAERNFERSRVELESRMISVIEDAKDVKGIGPKVHQALVHHVLERILGKTTPGQAEQLAISAKERSRIRKELANTKWSEVDDEQLIQIQTALSIK